MANTAHHFDIQSKSVGSNRNNLNGELENVDLDAKFQEVEDAWVLRKQVLFFFTLLSFNFRKCLKQGNYYMNESKSASTTW